MAYDALSEMLMQNARWKTGQSAQWAANAREAARPAGNVGGKMFPRWMSGGSRKAVGLGSKYAPGGVRASAGTAATSSLGSLLALYGAAQGGWSTGRLLGNTPTLTDPAVTYDKVYQDLFTRLLRKKKRQK